jgi:type VI protein secretion system component VasK
LGATGGIALIPGAAGTWCLFVAQSQLERSGQSVWSNIWTWWALLCVVLVAVVIVGGLLWARHANNESERSATMRGVQSERSRLDIDSEADTAIEGGKFTELVAKIRHRPPRRKRRGS